MQLFNEHFLEFIHNLPLQTSSMDELALVISKNIAIIADVLQLGKIDCETFIAPGIFEPKGKKEYYTLFCSANGYTTQSVNDNYEYAKNIGTINLTSYASEHTVWDDSMISNVHALHKCIFLLCSRCQLMSMSEKAFTHDQLTGLLNTTAFLKEGRALVMQSNIQEYTGLFINLKNFRYLNQNLGNPAGDEALRKYASRLQNFLQPDELLTRPGGDNFAILVRNERLEELLRYISTIRVNVFFDNCVQSVDLASKIGIYQSKPKDTVVQVLNNASLALSIAKQSLHHDHVWFREEMLETSVKKQFVLDLFPSALEHNEFLAYYQPKVSSDTLSLCGCEALVRWRHDGKLVPPNEFIPFVEESSFICMLDFYMLEQVCQDIRQLLGKGLTPVRVSVNFSKAHLHNYRLAHDIMTVLNRYNIDPKYIEVELTESSAYEDFSSLIHFTSELRDFGIATSIDDFGTGYSSLNLLKDLPFNVVKLDRSFIADIHNGKKAEITVIGAIMRMVEELGMEVVCEGVENKEQLNFLKQYGNPIIQGYLFDRPLPIQDFEKRLENKKYTI